MTPSARPRPRLLPLPLSLSLFVFIPISRGNPVSILHLQSHLQDVSESFPLSYFPNWKNTRKQASKLTPATYHWFPLRVPVFPVVFPLGGHVASVPPLNCARLVKLAVIFYLFPPSSFHYFQSFLHFSRGDWSQWNLERRSGFRSRKPLQGTPKRRARKRTNQKEGFRGLSPLLTTNIRDTDQPLIIWHLTVEMRS